MTCDFTTKDKCRYRYQGGISLQTKYFFLHFGIDENAGYMPRTKM